MRKSDSDEIERIQRGLRYYEQRDVTKAEALAWRRLHLNAGGYPFDAKCERATRKALRDLRKIPRAEPTGFGNLSGNSPMLQSAAEALEALESKDAARGHWSSAWNVRLLVQCREFDSRQSRVAQIRELALRRVARHASKEALQSRKLEREAEFNRLFDEAIAESPDAKKQRLCREVARRYAAAPLEFDEGRTITWRSIDRVVKVRKRR